MRPFRLMRLEGRKWIDSLTDWDPYPLLIPTCDRFTKLGITCYVESPEGRCIYPVPR